MYINIKEEYKEKAYTHHEYNYLLKDNQTHDSSYLLSDIDCSKLPKGWEIIDKFQKSLSKEALVDAMLEIDLDLSRFAVFVNAKTTNLNELNNITGVDLSKEFDLFIDKDTVHVGLWFDGNTGELKYLRKAVNVLKQSEKDFGENMFNLELESLCKKFDISKTPKLPFVKGAIFSNFYTFELHRGGECKKLQFEIFVRGMYQYCNLYFDDKAIEFLSSIKQELDYPCINHYKIDFIDDNWQMIKIYLYGLGKECEFLKDGNFSEYRQNLIVDESEIIESLQSKLKRNMSI
ncbi:hypothetical protein [Francisella marina]|uniref:Uncharacterized protein n=1 Tax=Francisella marina TaxID=2249302 RepID=A0ABX5ZGH9_9GAMM|nr:hypothetical protein [Francisella marina]QEO57541.1 hypothetical protein F0R74_06635 [Francisella marina]